MENNMQQPIDLTHVPSKEEAKEIAGGKPFPIGWLSGGRTIYGLPPTVELTAEAKIPSQKDLEGRGDGMVTKLMRLNIMAQMMGDVPISPVDVGGRLYMLSECTCPNLHTFATDVLDPDASTKRSNEQAEAEVAATKAPAIAG